MVIRGTWLFIPGFIPCQSGWLAGSLLKGYFTFHDQWLAKLTLINVYHMLNINVHHVIRWWWLEGHDY